MRYYGLENLSGSRSSEILSHQKPAQETKHRSDFAEMTEPCHYFPTGAPRSLHQPDSLPTSRVARVCAASTLLITFGSLVAAALFSGKLLNRDAGILLDYAGLVLRGSVLYVDLPDFNPPITHYIHLIPVYLAGRLNLEIPTAFHSFVLILAVYSAMALSYLSSKLIPAFSLSSRLLLAAVCLLFSLWVLRAGEFGQRDHLFALAYIPWLYCREIRHTGGAVPGWIGLVVGLVGGPLFLVKPHFCVLVTLAEVWLLCTSRRFSCLWSSEILAVAGLAFVYTAHFFFIPSEIRDAYFLRWVPLALANYDVYNQSMSEIARLFPTKFWLSQIALILGVLALIAMSRLPNNWKLQWHGLVASTLLAWGIFIIQHKGWGYQLLPAISLEVLLAGTLVIILLERAETAHESFRLGPAIRMGGFLVVCFSLSLLSLSMAYAMFASNKGSDLIYDFVRLIDQQVAPDEKVTFISTSVVPAYPTLIYAKRLPGTRFLQAGFIAYVYKGAQSREDGTPPYHSPSEDTPDERRFLDELGSDILKNRPKLVFIQFDKDCQACPKGFRIEEYLAVEGWLQRYMKNYSRRQTLHGFAMYVRK